MNLEVASSSSIILHPSSFAIFASFLSLSLEPPHYSRPRTVIPPLPLPPRQNA
jgi:hypothetical protein